MFSKIMEKDDQQFFFCPISMKKFSVTNQTILGKKKSKVEKKKLMKLRTLGLRTLVETGSHQRLISQSQEPSRGNFPRGGEYFGHRYNTHRNAFLFQAN